MRGEEKMKFQFGPVVKERMKQMGMKPSHLARETGYCSQYIRDLLAGRRRWNETAINKTCEALGIDVEFKVTLGSENTRTESDIPD